MKSALLAFLVVTTATPAIALPPPEDQPEEVARTEIITEARSPIDNEPLNAAEYAALQEQLREGQPVNPRDEVSPELRRTIGLLRLRRFIRTVFPFIPLR
ncbi:hypothetical protein ACQ4M3_18890 [Leptolyngbya sp. AN03gr2]|uniref:hypothetical protein n=1 Tax=unclassified Leptolyngbya TaxID=2650499 RepID=UPI003D312DC7